MTAPTRSQAEHALATLIHCVRPDWATPGILATIRKKPSLPIDVLAAAALWATSRRDQHTPHLIGEDDGMAWDRLIGKTTVMPTAVTPRDRCPYHPSQPKAPECPDCAEHQRTVITDPARIRAIRNQEDQLQ